MAAVQVQEIPIAQAASRHVTAEPAQVRPDGKLRLAPMSAVNVFMFAPFRRKPNPVDQFESNRPTSGVTEAAPTICGLSEKNNP